MPRKLSPDEAALWSRIAATVRPLAGKPRVKAADAAPPPLPSPSPDAGAAASRAPPRSTVAKHARPPHAFSPTDASLDGTWDRRMRRGQLVVDRAIDLHGCSRDSAYALLSNALRDAAAADMRVLLVVTGKGSRDPERGRGVIRASLPHWLETPALRPYVAALRPAHPRHGGAGAWYVILKRRR